MNKTRMLARECLLTATALAMSTAAVVHADDRLDFEVQGAVTPSCGLALSRVRIDLDTVAASELGAVGDGSRWRGTSFTGVDCVGATKASVTMRAAAHPADPRYIAPVGGAQGVAIEMRTADGQPLPPDGSSPVEFSWAGGIPALAFQARYVRVGPLKAGDAVATALVQIQWE
ncbi:type 1 fimbria pilin [Luteibacter jiangsuensis]|uniref:Type 1 fimbria pilin n=1 Tax=Luteibacter jiangsuensis TaxID=637577 RepID=A0ABT9T0E9_9GAMM|nr:fimbrial protein [Luteibacter jiangsuensis]MDQ0010741.1 type 1 fimbria pilin [Luteibacter jiangsuensis]